MKKAFLILITCIIASLTSCSDINKGLYGTYAIKDSTKFFWSHFTFYPGHTYSFYAATCFGHNRDSGSYTLNNDTLCFISFDKERDRLRAKNGSTNPHTLTGEKFIYQTDTIRHFDPKAAIDKYVGSKPDCWIKEAINK